MPERKPGSTYAERLERAVREYLDEYDAPVKDYALRGRLRRKLRDLIDLPN